MYDFSQIKYFYFLGIGGIGMSALARYFKARKKIVSGYDKTPTQLTDAMKKEGIKIHFEDDIGFFLNQAGRLNKNEILIVITPAIPADHKELNYFKKHGYCMLKRSELLGLITKETFTIAIAGTHGKTTTTALVTHILKHSGIDCTAFVGGIMANYNSNILIGKPASAGKVKKNVFVVEADEYDRSFLTLNPDIAVITSMDADHLDIYGRREDLVDSFNLFAKQTKKNGVLIHKKNLPVKKLDRQKIIYSITEDADVKAEKISVINGQFVFDVAGIKKASLPVPGRHNIENSIAAIAVAKKLGISNKKIKEALASFKGVKRRFEFIIKARQCVFIDDYAHHPEELRACISAVRELFPGKKISGIFQPHLFSRTRDFADEFARSLELLDEVILLDIYPAREKPMHGVDSKMLLGKIRSENKMLCSKKELLKIIAEKKTEVLITLGAGDIDALVAPVSEVLRTKFNIKKKNLKGSFQEVVVYKLLNSQRLQAHKNTNFSR